MINTSDKMVSVFMLAYNHEKYIDEAIKSIPMRREIGRASCRERV